MFRIICILTFAVAGLALTSSIGIPFRQLRIVNGTDAPQGKFPSAVAILNHAFDVEFNQWCGGSILNENYILTAGHCLAAGDSPSNYSVFAGNVDLLGNGVTISAAKFIIHEDFDLATAIHDIGLIKLASPLTFDENIQPASLPEQLQETAADTPAIIVGWGLTYTGGNGTQILQEVDTLVVSDADCQAIHGNAENYPYKPFDTNICVGVPGGGKGQCSGDSGGPLYADGQQVGIVSWSIHPCTIAPYPGVLTQVSHYIDWIAANAV